MVQWLRLHASITGGSGSIPGQGNKMPHGVAKKKKKKEYGNKTLMPESHHPKIFVQLFWGAAWTSGI